MFIQIMQIGSNILLVMFGIVLLVLTLIELYKWLETKPKIKTVIDNIKRVGIGILICMIMISVFLIVITILGSIGMFVKSLV